MLNQLLQFSYREVKKYPCCHQDKRVCNCYECLQAGYWGEPDTYDCPKKLNYYVAKYGATFSSVIFNYLAESHIVNLFENQELNVLSLGCGFCPDYYAITKYIEENGLHIHLNYRGIDKSNTWNYARLSFPNLHYSVSDLLAGLNLNDSNLVFLNRIYSTLYNKDQHMPFLRLLNDAINSCTNDHLILVFNDVNSCNKGRDLFDRTIAPNFQNLRKYYSGVNSYHRDNWIHIQERMSHPIINNCEIDPINQIMKTVIFEYRK